MLQHKGRPRRCNINVVFSLSIACFNSVFSLGTLLFDSNYQFSIKKLRVCVIYKCTLYSNKYSNPAASVLSTMWLTTNIVVQLNIKC